jgi:hypothetical protein
MLTHEDRIRLLHDNRAVLLNRMFDELCRKPGSSAEQICTNSASTGPSAAALLVVRIPTT